MAGLALCGHELKVFGHDGMYQGGASIEPEELLQLASDIEGHPDNVCPCIYGGIQLGIRLRSGHWRSCRVNCPTDMQLVAFISNTVGKVSSVGGCSVLWGCPAPLLPDAAVFFALRAAFELRLAVLPVLPHPPDLTTPHVYPSTNTSNKLPHTHTHTPTHTPAHNTQTSELRAVLNAHNHKRGGCVQYWACSIPRQRPEF